MAGQQFEYGFDDIGNRKSTKAGGDQNGSGLRSASYGANGLNQYTNRTVPGAYDILGAATATSAVTVNGSSPYRKGEYFWKEITASNGSGPVWQTNTVTVSGGSTEGGNVLVPPATQTFGHDLDGNLTNDLVWAYLWDGENRLVQMSNVTTVASAARRKLDFNYDHQGRRFRKVMSTWNGSAWVAAQTNGFHYHGWNVLGDFVSASNFRHYLWGNDLSGSLQGAGGVGGLIAVRETNQVHFVAYDGNGNVAGLVNAADGAVSANYEYGPFGESIRASGVFAKNNPYRFSTKYQDAESDLLYYGHRFYNPSTGRWPNRDPLGELGGINLYGFVRNSAVNLYDPLGLTIPGTGPGAYPPYTQPPLPTPGTIGNNAKRFFSGYFLERCCTPKPSRLSDIPGVLTLTSIPLVKTTGPGGGAYEIYPFPTTPPKAVGGGGADPCNILVVKCQDSGFVAVFHFDPIDSPSRTLRMFSWPSGCSAIICGGKDSIPASNCLGDAVKSAANAAGLNVVGVSGNSACGVLADGTWWQHGN